MCNLSMTSKESINTMSRFWSPILREIQPYTPGEQPREENLIKLNTNENPYPPSPRVVEAVQAEAAESLRRYPDPEGTAPRETLARYYRVDPENVFVGNGSDEVLALAFLAPYVVHFIPSWDDSPIGAKLLPIFYAPLIAALTRRAHVSITVALMAPWLNHVLIGMPSIPMAIILTGELLIFSVVAERLARNHRGQFWLGPVSYLLAKPVSLLVLLAVPGFLDGTPSAMQFARGVVNAWPGLAVLALLSYYVPRRFPPDGAPA